jgi:fumarate reductase flavoprotein subunit
VVLSEAGAVAGARIAAHGGAEEAVAARAVILATGGFGADAGLVRELLPEIAGALYFGSEGCDGDALRIGRALGADTGYLDAYQGHGGVATPHSIMVTWVTVVHGAFLVNAAGVRFGDESTGYSEYAREVLKQPGGVAWVVLDERIDRLCQPFLDYANLVAQHGIAWCPDSPAAAARIGCQPAALGATLASATAAGSGEPDAFGRTSWEAPLTSPYGLVEVTGALFHTQGGVLTDARGAVLRQGAPIPGLYAAGGAAAGVSGHGPDGYLAGNGLLAALGLGYLAGRAAGAALTGPG